MIGTERDYVRSLHYIIENYTEELNREDIPQAMRGQRNVSFIQFFFHLPCHRIIILNKDQKTSLK